MFANVIYLRYESLITFSTPGPLKSDTRACMKRYCSVGHREVGTLQLAPFTWFYQKMYLHAIPDLLSTYIEFGWSEIELPNDKGTTWGQSDVKEF